MDIKKLNEKLNTILNEGTMDRNAIDFDTIGGDVQIYIDAWDYPKGQRVGFNSSSRGSIDFISDIKIDPETAENVRAREKELREILTPFIKQCVDEFDAKVIAKMEELGFKLEG